MDIILFYMVGWNGGKDLVVGSIDLVIWIVSSNMICVWILLLFVLFFCIDLEESIGLSFKFVGGWYGFFEGWMWWK